MTLADLFDKIADAYPDGMIHRAAATLPGAPNEGVPVGDPLAEFIVREIHDTFEEDANDETQLRLALDLIDSAGREIAAVQQRLYELWHPLAEAATQS